MRHFSSNITKLKNLMTFPQENFHNHPLVDFEEQSKVNILSLFLFHADLATPVLNRENVQELLNGTLMWPKQDGSTQCIKAKIDLEVLEKVGAISFYSNYCGVHFSNPPQRDKLHNSTKPLFDTLKNLSNILSGNEFIKPHFHLKRKLAEKLLRDQSIHFDINSIPELTVESEYIKIELIDRYYQNLLAEYLWKQFYQQLKNSRKKDLTGFNKWRLITQVYSGSELWNINTNTLTSEEKLEFLNYIQSLIEEDDQLQKPHFTLKNLWQCSLQFDTILIDTTIRKVMNSTANEVTNNSETISNIYKPLTLDEVKSKFIKGNASNNSSLISFIRNWSTVQQRRFRVTEFSIFDNFPKTIADNDIHIARNSISSPGRLEKLLALSKNDSELKHILFNILPHRNEIDYLLYLLCRPDTASAATYLFSHNVMSVPYDLISSQKDSLHRVYFPLICNEYFKVVFKNLQACPIEEIVELIIYLSKDSISETTKDIPTSFIHSKDCLEMLLNQFSNEHVEIFAELLVEKVKSSDQRPGELAVWKFYILFWLLERCQGFGLLNSKDLNAKVQLTIAEVYINSFNSCLDKPTFPFEASHIMDAFPWWRIEADALNKLLDLIKKPGIWIQKLKYTDDGQGHSHKRLTRSYFQLSLCLSSPKRIQIENDKIHSKVVDLFETCGFFKSPTEHVGIFEQGSSYDYPLWQKFSSMIDELDDCSFNKIYETLKDDAPINLKLEAYEQTNRKDRQQKLLNLIKEIPETVFNDLGISTLEDSLIFACSSGQIDLAKTILEKGLEILVDENTILRQGQFKAHFMHLSQRWKSYEFKVKILVIKYDSSKNIESRIASIESLSIPFQPPTAREKANKLHPYHDCNVFKQMVSAGLFVDINPAKAFDKLDLLYKNEKNIQNAGNRFIAQLACLDDTQSIVANYKHALYEWTDFIKSDDPQEIDDSFIANWFSCLHKINDYKNTRELWLKLSEKQRNNLTIAIIYCKSLASHGEHHSARIIFDRLKDCNKEIDEKSKKTLQEIDDIIIQKTEISVAIALENRPKSIDSLRRAYHEIYSKDLNNLIKITKGTTIEQFLYNQITLILGELQLRKNNLNSTNITDSKKDSYRIINEDPINDWFTSLFDHQNSYLGLSCRDQKRGGQSPSGKNPGEIDFFLCDNNNTRISILEAFRLFSKDTKAINEHLDKISGYDQECLSPVFILVYCDVDDFSSLCSKYLEHNIKRNYKGFSQSTYPEESLKIEEDKGSVRFLKEVRYRDTMPISIYHIMINLRFR